ncbi:hypothetical protein ACFO3J_10180 [Streptomyces polygonati]|uniref:Radical SAM protein n=1 Tax=Streptomyces polygonati TaxID=1617087 RepID=A0ABV8HNU0_9ACTN
MRRLTLSGVEAARAVPGRAALLYLTDRCPVGCAHCSVDSLPLGPRITDGERFGQVLDTLCAEPALSVVGISGGEPFLERAALTAAVRRLTEAGKRVVPYTSGYWGRSWPPPPWVGEVLRLSSCLVLGADAFHAARLPAGALANAVRAAAGAGTWVVCQVLEGEAEHRAAEEALRGALGDGWEAYAEIGAVPLLPYGRAGELRPPGAAGPAARPLSGPGRCTAAGTPVVRYDGRVSACCNEVVAMGGGPAALRHRITDPGVLPRLAADPYLTALTTLGAAAVTALPRLRDLADEPVTGLCDLCWRIAARGTDHADLRALALLAGSRP